MHAQPLQRTGLLVRLSEHPPPVPGRFRDPAREKAGVALAQRALDLLDAASVLGERSRERLRIVEEDVDPDTRVRAGDPRHVAQRPAGRSERLVPVDARRARLVQQQVRERVREVARQRDEPVVRLRIDRHRHRTKRDDEAVQQPVALRIGRRDRRQEPRRAAEQLAVRMRGAVRLRAAHGMPADEAPVADGLRDRSLRRADIGDRRRLAARRQHCRHLRGNEGHRRRHDRELGGGDRLLERPRRLHRPALGRNTQRLGIDVPAAHLVHPGRARREPDRGSDQPGADDCQALHGLPDRAAHQLGQRADLVREVGEVGDGNLLRPVAQRLLRARVHLDDDPVRARRHRRARQR